MTAFCRATQPGAAPERRGSQPPDVTVALGEALMGPKMLVMAVISPVMVATIVAGVVLLAEPLEPYHILCTLLIVAGVVGISVSGMRGPRPLDPKRPPAAGGKAS